jgi:hypothetical protein
VLRVHRCLAVVPLLVAVLRLQNATLRIREISLRLVLRTFAALGGMPEAVAVYAEGRSLLEADRIKEGILGTLRDDFAKYRRRISHERLTRVFDRLPALVARKFKYVNVSREDTAREIGRCIGLLSLPLYLADHALRLTDEALAAP